MTLRDPHTGRFVKDAPEPMISEAFREYMQEEYSRPRFWGTGLPWIDLATTPPAKPRPWYHRLNDWLRGK